MSSANPVGRLDAWPATCSSTVTTRRFCERQEVSPQVLTIRSLRLPKVFTRIKLHYIVTGRGLATAQVERAIKLSKEKYCSATIMLAHAVEITYDLRIVEGDRVESGSKPQ